MLQKIVISGWDVFLKIAPRINILLSRLQDFVHLVVALLHHFVVDPSDTRGLISRKFRTTVEIEHFLNFVNFLLQIFTPFIVSIFRHRLSGHRDHWSFDPLTPIFWIESYVGTCRYWLVTKHTLLSHLNIAMSGWVWCWGQDEGCGVLGDDSLIQCLSAISHIIVQKIIIIMSHHI